MINGEKALSVLKEGNERFSEGKSIHPNRDKDHMETLRDGQKPFAAIISCSDSRVPVEIIFDVGLGDIFVIRSAGHVLSKEALGSMEYAVNNLGVKLVVILGHENCGAINASVEIVKNEKYEGLSENFKALVSHIYPVLKEKNTNIQTATITEITNKYIKYQLQDLKRKDKVLAQKVNAGEIKLVGAYYKITEGKVDFFE